MPHPRRSTQTTPLTRGLLSLWLAGGLGLAGACLASTASADTLGGTISTVAAVTAPVPTSAHVEATTPVTPVAVSLGAAANGTQAKTGTTVKVSAARTSVKAGAATAPATGPSLRAAASVSPSAPTTVAPLSYAGTPQPAVAIRTTGFASTGTVPPGSPAAGGSPVQTMTSSVDLPVDTLGQPTWSTVPAGTDLQLASTATEASGLARMARPSDMVVVPPADGVLGRIAADDQTLVAVLVMGLLAATFVLAAEIRAARPHLG